MIRRHWQSMMIALARSSGWKNFMQNWGATSALASRYVGGADPASSIATAKRLADQKIASSLFYLGEYVDTDDLVRENVENKINVARALGRAGLDVHVSVDPTQVGCSMDWDMGADNIARIAEAVRGAAGNAPGVHCLMLDMEDSAVTQKTIDLFDDLHGRGFLMAQTLQAYLKRTRADMERKIEQGAKVRLVKGAFAAPPEISFSTHAQIKANYQKLIDLMLSEKAKASGFYPIFATHDHRLHEYACEAARRNGWERGRYEFEMLYGARDDVARSLADAGERVRLYLPFGEDWWPYAVRRIGENPSNAMLLGRAVLARA